MGHDTKLLALLPVVGLCSCTLQGELEAPDEWTWTPGLIEAQPEREPLSVAEALVRSGRESLTNGHFAAAYETLILAKDRTEEVELELELEVDLLDALIGLGDVEAATGQANAVEYLGRNNPAIIRQLQARRADIHELRNARGFGECEAAIDGESRPLQRTDAFAAWNELRSGLPADHAIPIPEPTDEAAIHAILCPAGCTIGEPSFARLEGDNEATIALVVPHEDGSFSIMPDLLHSTWSSCDDETTLATERHGDLVRVRAFADRIEYVPTSDWQLVELPSYGPSSQVTGSSSSYQPGSSGYQYGSSGYQYGSSGYQYGYYHNCGGGDGYDDYGDYDDTCQPHEHVERDVIVDLARGEVILDIVRTGERGSALGHVTMAPAAAGPVVSVEACGVSRSLSLSYT